MGHPETEAVRGSENGMMPSIHAIITARGGSKGLPRKNLHPLLGKPLIEYSIRSALGCGLISRCIVTTDDPEIGRVSTECGAEVVVRPAELATDNALSRDAVAHVLEHLIAAGEAPEYFLLLQPTSPLRTSAHVTECISRFIHSGAASSISVTEAEHPPFKMLEIKEGVLSPLFDRESLHRPRQLLPRVVRQNGAIYLAPTKEFLERRTFFIEPVLPFLMNQEDSIDIDTEMDIRIAAVYLERYCDNQSAGGRDEKAQCPASGEL